MHRLIIGVEAERKEAQNAREEHQSAAKEIQTRLTQVEIEKRTLMETYQAEAEAAINSAREELKQAINLLKIKKRPVQADVTKRFESVREELLAHFQSPEKAPAFSPCGELREGQNVFHIRLKQHGVVQSIDPSGGRAAVMLGAVKISADLRDLQAVANPKGGHSETRPRSVNWSFTGGPLWKSPLGGLHTRES